jgi:hypothetical protein
MSKHTKTGKIYKMTIQTIPNGHKIFQMVIIYDNIFHFKALQKFTRTGIFGLKKTSGNPGPQEEEKADLQFEREAVVVALDDLKDLLLRRRRHLGPMLCFLYI